MESKQTGWLWYPGDLELYHTLRQNFSRVERGMGWPAYWKSSSFRQRVVFWREYRLTEQTSFRVYARGQGFVRVIEETEGDWHIDEISRSHERREYKYPFGDTITCGPGKVTVIIHVGRIEALPAAYVEGDVIRSDVGWQADDYVRPVPAASDPVFNDKDQDPAEWPCAVERMAPVRTEEVPGGTLYEWETELTAALEITAAPDRLAAMTVYPGESRDEALDTEHCYLRWKPEITADRGQTALGRTPVCAVRYAFIPGPPVEVQALYQYVDYPVRASFVCDDPLLNRIWEVAVHTFRLCCGVFFIDGIKRDRWIWSGDAYQSMFVNRYLLADPGIERRTLLALRGSDPMETHINTIMDYSLFWVLAVQEHYYSAWDKDFLASVYPKVCSLLDFCAGRLDDKGFLTARDRDWVYIDWADLDKEGPIAGEQFLYAAALKAAAEMAEILGETDRQATYARQAQALREQIRSYYWSEEKGAYIDSFVSGRKHVTRQTNILALRTGMADEDQTDRILENVLLSDEAAPIRTPYFQFYALDALGQLEQYDEILAAIRGYWGGMLERGAVTFWEEFDPAVTGTAQYDMYGDRFGKSLCHAWAASPVYLLARYLVGLETIMDCSEGEEKLSFILAPQLSYFGKLDCTLPVGMDGASVQLYWDGHSLRVRADGTEGYLRADGCTHYKLEDGVEFVTEDYREDR